MLKLAAEATDRPELYDFLFGSGVVREEEGVDVLRGAEDGDLETARISGTMGDCTTVTWGVPPGTRPLVDIRFIRRVSVGLIVRAPSPVAWPAPGMTDARLAEPAPFSLGDRGMPVADLAWSDPKKLLSSALRVLWLTLGGGPTDFALDALDVLRPRVGSPKTRRLPPSIEERLESGMGLDVSALEATLGRRRGAFLMP